MRIFNATNSTLSVPWGTQRLSIGPKSFSGDILGTPEFIKSLITVYNEDELAILVGGPFELSMCASVPACVIYVAQTDDEIYRKFGIVKDKQEKVEPMTDKKKVEPTPEPEPESEPNNGVKECDGDCDKCDAEMEFKKEEPKKEKKAGKPRGRKKKTE